MRHRAPDDPEPMGSGDYSAEETDKNLRALDPVKFGYRQRELTDEALNRLIDEYRDHM